MKVSEFHFSVTHIHIYPTGLKKLRSTALPILQSKVVKSSRKAPAVRNVNIQPDLHTSDSESDNENCDTEMIQVDIDDGPDGASNGCMECESLENEILRLREENRALNEEIDTLRVENDYLRGRQYNFDNISKDDKLFTKCCGIPLDKFHMIYDLIEPGQYCENIKLHQTGSSTGKNMSSIPEGSSSSAMNKPNKSGQKTKIRAVDQLFLVLVWMRNGFPQSHLAWLLDIPKSTILRYLITWVNLLYHVLGMIPIWPGRELVDMTMPSSFKETYPTTRCIIDCTELFCQVPSSLASQSALYSHFKHHVTYKDLVGISPSGALTFVSQLYDGSTSDVEIVRRSGLLTKELWNEGDSIMADRGFTIANDLKKLKVDLNIPAFLNGREWFDTEDVQESQTIEAVRIHVERQMERIKRFKIIRNEISLSMHGSINQIWTVVCMLTNYMPPLIQKDAACIAE